MGKRGNIAQSPPIQDYRKQIGKHYKKLTKSNVTDMKRHADARSSATKFYNDAIVVTGCVLASSVIAYFLLYCWLLQ